VGLGAADAAELSPPVLESHMFDVAACRMMLRRDENIQKFRQSSDLASVPIVAGARNKRLKLKINQLHEFHRDKRNLDIGN